MSGRSADRLLVWVIYVVCSLQYGHTNKDEMREFRRILNKNPEVLWPLIDSSIQEDPKDLPDAPKGSEGPKGHLEVQHFETKEPSVKVDYDFSNILDPQPGHGHDS